MTSLHTLLAGAIDYAGLFPPAKLAMDAAVRNYASYLGGQHSWALGRFIVPAGRLSEFEHALLDAPEHVDAEWHVSALVGPDLSVDMAHIRRFNEKSDRGSHRRAAIDVIEARASGEEDIHRLGNAVPRSFSVFTEIPIETDPSPLLDAIKTAGTHVKVRTGGVTPQAFPSSRDLARFLDGCARRKVAFKATAGLHHALRAQYPLTYEPDSPRGTMFGFLNVVTAAAVAFQGGEVSDLIEVLEEQSAAAFRFTGDELVWRGHRCDSRCLASMRKEFMLSFGSCSFTEPVHDLTSLGLL